MSSLEEVAVAGEELSQALTISTVELRRRLTDPDLTIVDVRALHAYNGWRPNGEARGGHIPGAVAFPSAWLTSVDDAEVVRLLHSKDIVTSQEVVLYGNGRRRLGGRSRLTDLGHTGVRVYEHGWDAWAADETLPIERLPNYERLVHTDWLRQVLDGGRPEAAPAGRSSSSTSTSASRRSTRRTTCRGRSTSTRTSSRTRSTGTVERPRSSMRRCARSASRTTRRSSSTAATPRATPTRSGRAAGPARSPRPVRR